jgi:dCMP deaminase
MDETLMHMAWTMAARSTCSYRHVGCVISREGRLLTTGYNGAPSGMPHCVHPRRVDGQPVTPCTNAVHDVANAIAFAARHGSVLQGAQAHVTATPCVSCAQLLIQAGIVRVVADEAYRDLSGWELLAAGGVDAIMFEEITHAAH